MTKCPDCKKYVCECETNQNPAPWTILPSLKEEINAFEMPTPRTFLHSKPKLVEEICPKCDGKGYIPNPILCGDDPCFTCGSTGIILVRDDDMYRYAY